MNEMNGDGDELDTFGDVEGGLSVDDNVRQVALSLSSSSSNSDDGDDYDEENDVDDHSKLYSDPRPPSSSSFSSKATRLGGAFAKYLPTPEFLRDNEEYLRSEQTMSVMKDAIQSYSQDKYFESGEVTAKVKLDHGEEEEDAVIISLNNVHKTYLLGVEGVPALRGVTMQVRRGEFLVIYGTSGGGKTSLLNIMGTIDKPTKGNLKICGTRISKSTSDATFSDLRRNKVGFVFQTFNLLSALTAEENVELPMILSGRLGRLERRHRARELLAKVGMGKRMDHQPSQLSGGEQQRVTIARAIANEPEVLLLDEPTGDLDSVNTLIVMKLLLELNREEGITLVMVTHDVALKAFADRVIWMRDGKVQRVEQVPRHVRDDSYEQLNEDFEELLGTGLFDQSVGRSQSWASWAMESVPVIGPFLSSKLGFRPAQAEYTDAGVWDEKMEKEVGADEDVVLTKEVTEVRAPQDYHTHVSNVRDEEGSSGASVPTAGSGTDNEEDSYSSSMAIDKGKGRNCSWSM